MKKIEISFGVNQKTGPLNLLFNKILDDNLNQVLLLSLVLTNLFGIL